MMQIKKTRIGFGEDVEYEVQERGFFDKGYLWVEVQGRADGRFGG